LAAENSQYKTYIKKIEIQRSQIGKLSKYCIPAHPSIIIAGAWRETHANDNLILASPCLADVKVLKKSSVRLCLD
jgi:hypothetical protein